MAKVEGLPVTVWTYSSSFTADRKSQHTPEGLLHLSTGFVFVSYNYRIGMTGLANGPTFFMREELQMWPRGIFSTSVSEEIYQHFWQESTRDTGVGFSASCS